MSRLLVGMSGGVDSAAAALLVQENGDTAVGVTLRLCPQLQEDAERDAAAVCRALHIDHSVLDYRTEFSAVVIENFITEYLDGRTPNPCILCNEKIKFGILAEKAKQMGCEALATGHYATTKRDANGRVLLCRPRDRNKDQTYMLCRLNQEQLAFARFPLANLTKSEIRELARQKGLAVAGRSDSQDICFVPSGDYAAFIEKQVGKQPCGEFRSPDGTVLGIHAGLIRYTVGQRKGLGIALGKPAYVLEKNVSGNYVVLGEESELSRKRVEIGDMNYIPFETLSAPLRVTAKLRYRQTEQPALLHPTSAHTAVLEFEQPQRAPSAGQTAVFYDGDTVLGGGTIL